VSAVCCWQLNLRAELVNRFTAHERVLVQKLGNHRYHVLCGEILSLVVEYCLPTARDGVHTSPWQRDALRLLPRARAFQKLEALSGPDGTKKKNELFYLILSHNSETIQWLLA
jgi:hypothetical protein